MTFQQLTLEGNSDYEKWLDDAQDAAGLYTNKEVLEMHPNGNYPQGWIHPWLTPEEEIAELRRLHDSAEDWQYFVKINIPTLDPLEEKHIKWKEDKEKRKERDIDHCGRYYSKNHWLRPGDRLHFTSKCKRKDCPKCRVEREQATAKRIERIVLSGRGRKVTLTEKEEKEFRKQHNLHKDDYLRQPHDDGTITLMFERDDIGEPLEYSDVEELSKEPEKSTRRISGNLGKNLPPPMPLDEDEPEQRETKKENPIGDYDWDAPEYMTGQLTARVLELETFPESTIYTTKELHKQALAELILDVPEKYDLDFAQYVIYQVEEKMAEVAKRHCAKIHFLYVERKDVSEGDLDWSLVEKILKKREKTPH